MSSWPPGNYLSLCRYAALQHLCAPFSADRTNIPWNPHVRAPDTIAIQKIIMSHVNCIKCEMIKRPIQIWYEIVLNHETVTTGEYCSCVLSLSPSLRTSHMLAGLEQSVLYAWWDNCFFGIKQIKYYAAEWFLEKETVLSTYKHNNHFQLTHKRLSTFFNEQFMTHRHLCCGNISWLSPCSEQVDGFTAAQCCSLQCKNYQTWRNTHSAV